MSNKEAVRPSFRVSFSAATALVVAAMIGTGVYTSLGFQLEHIHSGFPILALWIVGGVLALCGALSYAELAAMFPRSGGEYNLLSRIYHPALGFAAGFVSITVGFPAPVALAAKAFGTYASSVVPGLNPQLLSCGAVLLATLVHVRDVKMGSRIQTCITSVNVVLICVLILAAFSYGTPQDMSFAPSRGDLTTILSGSFAVSLMYVMYAYSGWNAPIYISGELFEAPRTIKHSLLAGTLLVMLLYIGINGAFLYVSPIHSLQGQLEVGKIAGGMIFGAEGGRLVSLLISIGLLSCVSSMMWTGPRVAQVMGEDLTGLAALAETTSRGVPLRAIVLQLGIVLFMLLGSSFQSILLVAETSLLFSSLMCVIGVIILRITRPHAQRTCKCPMMPFTPLLFCLITVFMIAATLRANPAEGVTGLSIFALAAASYFAIKRRSPA